MTTWLPLILLTFAVSIDGYGVGLTYGIRKMKIPFKSIVVIACCSAFSMAAAMMIGQFISTIIAPEIAGKIGGIILIGVGVWVLYQFIRPKKRQNELLDEKIILKFEIKSLGVVVNILQRPLTADFDNSGTINGVEAFVLGFALSLDAFGAGIGAAMIGFSPILLAFSVAIMCSLFIWAGLQSGKLFSNSAFVQRLTFFPGVLLILIGLWKL